jgi:hypothetical protein
MIIKTNITDHNFHYISSSSSSSSSYLSKLHPCIHKPSCRGRHKVVHTLHLVGHQHLYNNTTVDRRNDAASDDDDSRGGDGDKDYSCDDSGGGGDDVG